MAKETMDGTTAAKANEETTAAKQRIMEFKISLPKMAMKIEEGRSVLDLKQDILQSIQGVRAPMQLFVQGSKVPLNDDLPFAELNLSQDASLEVNYSIPLPARPIWCPPLIGPPRPLNQCPQPSYEWRPQPSYEWPNLQYQGMPQPNQWPQPGYEWPKLQNQGTPQLELHRTPSPPPLEFPSPPTPPGTLSAGRKRSYASLAIPHPGYLTIDIQIDEHKMSRKVARKDKLKVLSQFVDLPDPPVFMKGPRKVDADKSFEDQGIVNSDTITVKGG